MVIFMQHFHPYLLGQQFAICMDNGFLTYVAVKFPRQLACFLEKLKELDFDIVLQWGHTNTNVMSRLPCWPCGRTSEPSGADIFATTMLQLQNPFPITGTAHSFWVKREESKSTVTEIVGAIHASFHFLWMI